MTVSTAEPRQQSASKAPTVERTHNDFDVLAATAATITICGLQVLKGTTNKNNRAWNSKWLLGTGRQFVRKGCHQSNRGSNMKGSFLGNV